MINKRQRKSELRSKHKKLRQSCPQKIKYELDGRLTEAFLSSEEYKSCTTLFAYHSMPIEVDTSKIIKTALKDGKKVALPRCNNRSGDMSFYYISSLQDLKQGFFSLFEPDTDICESVEDFSQGLCIVPGLCYDYEGYRIGFGKGYYDRFLDAFKGITVGLCYSRNIERSLPRGEFDVHVDILITEKFLSRINKDYIRSEG